MKSFIKFCLVLASFLVIPASHTMHQNPVAQPHIRQFSKALSGIMNVKTDVEADRLARYLLNSKNSTQIKKIFDALSKAYIEDIVGIPRINTFYTVDQKDELRNIFNRYSTKQQAEFVARTLRELDNQKKAVEHTRKYKADLKKLSDAMTGEKEKLKKLWLDYDKSNKDLREQQTLAKSRAEELHKVTRKYDKEMHDLTGQHVQRILFPAQDNQAAQPAHLMPAVDPLD